MAQKVTLVCDACGKEKEVFSYEIKRLDSGQRFSGDLCAKCWATFTKTFGPEPVASGRRRKYEIIDFDAIPRLGE